jgi:hypothetical protein
VTQPNDADRPAAPAPDAPAADIPDEPVPLPDHVREAQGRDVADIVGRLGEDDITTKERAQLLGRLAGVAAQRAKFAGAKAVGSGKYLADLLVDAAPHIPVRDLATLQEHHKGLTGEPLADALVRNAQRTTAGIGAAGGAVAAIEWAAMPVLVAVPLEVVVETVAVAAVEVKLTAELHAVYGIPVEGSGAERAIAFAGAWANRRGIDPMRPWTIPNVLGIAGRQQLAKRMLMRFARNLGTVIPFLVGAAVGARVNHTETKRLGETLRADLRRVAAERASLGYPAAAPATIVVERER